MKLVELVGRQRLHRPDAGLRGRGPRVQRDEPRQSEGVRDDGGEAAVVRTLDVYRGRHPYCCLAVRESVIVATFTGRESMSKDHSVLIKAFLPCMPNALLQTSKNK